MNVRRSLVAVIERRFRPFIKSQRKTMAALCEGLLVAGRLGLASIGRAVPGKAKTNNKIKRVDRFAGNKGVCVDEAMACLMAWLGDVARQTVTVALDWTDIGDGRVVLCAAATLGHRAIPLAWLVMAKGHFTRKRKSRNDAEEQMIQRVQQALGGYSWVLVADRGFARASLFRKLAEWDVRYVIRASSTPWIETGDWAGQLCDLPRQAGRTRSYPNVLYHKQARVPVGLVATHREPAPEPWYLVTNLEKPAQAIACYRRRSWIEQQFRDAKTHMGLDELKVRKAGRIERLMILMAIVMALAVLTGLKWASENPGEDPGLTTHKKGRSVSLFLLGLHLLRQHGPPRGFLCFRLTEALEVP